MFCALSVCAVCANDFYPSGSFECLECSPGNAASAMLSIMWVFVRQQPAPADLVPRMSLRTPCLRPFGPRHGWFSPRSTPALVGSIRRGDSAWSYSTPRLQRAYGATG